MSGRVPLGRLMRRLFWPYRGRILFFAAIIGLGVGSLFAVANLLALVERGIYEQARSLMAADLTVSSWQPLSDAQRARIDGIVGPIEGLRETQTVEMASMVRPSAADATPFLVTVKAIADGYPLHGTLEVEPPGAVARVLSESVCLISKEMAAQRGIAVGDRLRLGESDLEVAGVIVGEPDAGLIGALSFAPRVMVGIATLERTGLVQFGSRVRRRAFYALPEGTAQPAAALEDLQKRLVEALDTPQVQVQTYSQGAPAIRDTLSRVAMFFAMVALVTLVLGTIGVIVGVLSLLRDHLRDIATLRAMGVGPGSIRRAYLGLLVIVGLAGGALGLGFGLALDWAVLEALGGELFGVGVGLSVGTALEALALALIVAIGFNLASVGALARLPPNAVLADTEDALRLRKRDLAAMSVLMVGLVFGYLYLGTRSLPSALAFTGGLVATTLLCLALVGATFVVLRGALAALARTSGRRGLLVRQGLLSVVRNRRRSLVYLLTLGIGLGLTTTLGLVQSSLERELRIDDDRALPNLFMIDIQSDQVSSIQAIAAQRGLDPPQLSPLIRARLTHLEGQAVADLELDASTPEARQRARAIAREYSLSHKDDLSRSETIVAGEFWQPGETRPLLSLEERFASRLGLELGDTMTFDVQGRPLTATITSLRRVNWLSLQPNFFAVMPSAVLGPAPQTLIGSVRVPERGQIASVQAAIFERHPNVSVIDLAPVFGEVRSLLGYLAATIRGLALLCALVGLLILLGSFQLGRQERLARAGILRALGFETRQIIGVDLVEYGLVGLVATLAVGVVSVGFASALTGAMQVGLHLDSAFALALIVPLLLPVLAGLLYQIPGYRRSAQASFTRRAG